MNGEGVFNSNFVCGKGHKKQYLWLRDRERESGQGKEGREEGETERTGRADIEFNYSC